MPTERERTTRNFEVNMVVQQVSPREIRFTQDSISEAFGDHGENAPIDRENIEDTFRKLLYGDVSVNSIRNIAVVRKDGQMWVVSGNRRLYVFKKLEQYGRISTITVNVVPINQERFERMFTTKNEGISIYIRQDRKRQRGMKLEARLTNIYYKWVGHGRPTDGYPVYDINDHANLDDSYFSGGSTWSPPTWPPEPPTPRVSPPARPPVTQPRPQPIPQPRPPPVQQKKDDSWCAIL